MDYKFEINIISKIIYERGKWPINIKHEWILEVANNKRRGLYDACLVIKTKIGNVEVD